MAALYSMKVFEPFLLCRKFTLVADHEPLTWMHKQKDPGQRIMRWMFKFANYHYTFKYKPGKLNCNADALSRNPEEVPEDPEETPNEEQINKDLPSLKIMMIRRKLGTAGANRPNSPATPDEGNSNVPSTRPRANTAGDGDARRGRGRPIGAKTQKVAPSVDHSLIAARTRARIKQYNEKQKASRDPLSHLSRKIHH